MRSLYELASRDLRVREIFVKLGADPFLNLIHHILMREHNANKDRLMLLSACRRAMVCTEDNIIHGLAKELLYLSDPIRSADSIRRAELAILWGQLASAGCNL